MQYSEIKTMFTGILNRRDITPTQINTFLQMGIQYVQRKLRVPSMERTVGFISDGTKYMPIPSDFLEIIAIYSDDASGTNKLEKRDLQTVLKHTRYTGSPLFYYRDAANFWIGPKPADGSNLYLTYYADATNLAADTDHNWMTDTAPTVLVYSALKYAADFFLDDRKQAFADTLGEDLADLQEMASRDELVNASISPAYPQD